jgi:hypothetical protein
MKKINLTNSLVVFSYSTTPEKTLQCLSKPLILNIDKDEFVHSCNSRINWNEPQTIKVSTTELFIPIKFYKDSKGNDQKTHCLQSVDTHSCRE